jgi:hypothetical protein
MRAVARREVNMDSSFTIKPRDTVSRTGIGRAGGVRTELAPSQSVSAAKPVAEAHLPHTEAVGREPVINPQAQALLSREQEERQRRARQAADEALLRRRAYGQAAPSPQPESAQAPDGDPHADIEV